MPRQLEVWLSGIHVGTLAQVDGRLAFTYASDWLSNKAAMPLSQSLPLQAEAFDDRATRPFFAGLLPEGAKRKGVAQALHVSRQNDFALLDGIGGECAGAVTLLEPGQTPLPLDAPDAVRWLDAAELVRTIDDMPSRPMRAGDADLRLSLAGAQDKLPVVAEGGRIGLPRFGTPSTHILKPAIPDIEASVLNEGFCMALAAALKLDVAPAAVHTVGEGGDARPYLLVARYDRQHTASGQRQRLHQEDFCQALGVPPETKYQNEGGPDLAQAFALLRQATRPHPETARLRGFQRLDRQPRRPRQELLAALRLARHGAGPAVRRAGHGRLSPAHRQDGHDDRWQIQVHRSAGPPLGTLRPGRRPVARAGEKTRPRRLPALAQATLAAFEAQGHSHPVLGQIVALIESRCALTTHRLNQPPAGADPDPAGTAVD